jgi:MYXO-CTERM domain-containing protein
MKMRSLIAMTALLWAAAAPAQTGWHSLTVDNLGAVTTVESAAWDEGRGFISVLVAGEYRVYELSFPAEERPGLLSPVASPVIAFSKPVAASHAPVAFDGATLLVGGDATDGRGLHIIDAQTFVDTPAALPNATQSVRALAKAPDGSGHSVAIYNKVNVLDDALWAHYANGDIWRDGAPLGLIGGNQVAVLGTHALIARHGLGSTFVLRNIDTATPAPAEYDLDSTGTDMASGLGTIVIAGPNYLKRTTDLGVGTMFEACDPVPAVAVEQIALASSYTAIVTPAGEVHLGPAIDTACGWSTTQVASGAPVGTFELIHNDVDAPGSPQVMTLSVDGGNSNLLVGWLNRPPKVELANPGTPPEVTEGGSASSTVIVKDPDDDPMAPAVSVDSVSCDVLPGLMVGPTLSPNGATLTVPDVGNGLCGGEPTTTACSISVSDADGVTASLTDFEVIVNGVDNEAPVFTGGVALDVTGPVDEGVSVSASVDVDDGCPVAGALRWEFLWGADEAAPAVDAGTFADGKTLDFYVPLLPAGVDADTLTIRVTATDDAAHSASVETTLDVTRTLPPQVTLDCAPQMITAGESFTATATAVATTPPATSYAWDVGGLTMTPDPADTASSIDVDVPVCSEENATVRVTPSAARTGDEVSCTVQVTPAHTPPALARVGERLITVPVAEVDRTIDLIVSITDECPSASNELRWNLSALPSDVWPAETSAAGMLPLDVDVGEASITLLAPGPAFANLVGKTGVVTVEVSDGGEATGSVDFELVFVAEPELAERVGVTIEVAREAPRSAQAGDIVRVRGELRTDLAVSLPGLAAAVDATGLAWLDESAEVEPSECGATGEVQLGEQVSVTAEGVRADCPLRWTMLARRGFGKEGATVADCRFGDEETVVTRCGGGLVAAGPRALALSCGSGGTAPSLWLFALVGLAAARRRRRGSPRQKDAATHGR